MRREASPDTSEFSLIGAELRRWADYRSATAPAKQPRKIGCNRHQAQGDQPDDQPLAAIELEQRLHGAGQLDTRAVVVSAPRTNAMPLRQHVIIAVVA